MDGINIPWILPWVNGQGIKAIADPLDSLMCADVGAHWGYWGEARTIALGDRTMGYLVVPAPWDGALGENDYILVT